MHQFRYLLEAHDVVVCTNHNPLTFAFAKEANPWSARQQRHQAYISEYTTAIEHVAGKDNTVTDTLLRIVIGNIRVQIGPNYHDLSLAHRGTSINCAIGHTQPASMFEISLLLLATPRSFVTFLWDTQGL